MIVQSVKGSSLDVKCILFMQCVMSENINVRVTRETKQGLIELGRKDQTYDDIISSLIQKEKSRLS